MKRQIVIADNLGDRWFGMPALLTSKGIESWEAFRLWCQGREVDVFIRFMPADDLPL